ncbi:MAG: hypothetical protein ACKVHR_20110 [Pirellulales bacterium]|jgi:hypothetical protein
MNRLLFLIVVLTFVPQRKVATEGFKATQTTEQGLGQLVRFDNDWFVNGNRQFTYVVSRRGKSSVELYTKSRGLCGVSQMSLAMNFDPTTKKYYSRIKITSGSWDYNIHRRAKWLPAKLVGSWDAEKSTMSWLGESLGADGSSLEMVAKFAGSESLDLEITGTGEFRHAYRRQSLHRIW